jgi:hypothetical protein
MAPAKLTQFTPSVTATTLWKTDVGGGEGRGWLRQHPAVANGRVYATDDAGNLVALDANTGKELWAANAVERAAGRSMLKFWKREKNEVARLLLLTGKADEAARELAKITQPRFPQLVDELRGDIALAKGDRDEARKQYEHALGKLDQAAPTRQLLELKLIDVGGEPPAKPET